MPAFAYRIPQIITLLGLMLLATFTWADKGPSRALLWPWYLYAQLLLLLPAFWLIAHGLLYGRIERFGRGLDCALLAFAAAMCAAAIASPFPGASTALLPIVLAPVAVAYVVRNWIGAPEGARDRAPALLACGGALALGLTTFLMLLVWLLRFVLPAHAAGVPWITSLGLPNDQLLGHTVYVSGVGLLTATWLAGLAAERRGWVRLACLAGAVLGTVLIFTTGSRSGFIGLGAWLLWYCIGETRRRRWRWYRTLGVALALGTAAATLVSLHPRMGVILRQWRETGTLNTGDRQRLAMAEFGGLILREHPLLGIGPGATPLVYPSYRARLSGGVESALQLHSTPVQWAADGGLCGLAAVAGIALALWWRRRHEPRSFAAGALLAYAAFALTDYQLDLPIFAVSIGVLLALCAVPAAFSAPTPGTADCALPSAQAGAAGALPARAPYSVPRPAGAPPSGIAPSAAAPDAPAPAAPASSAGAQTTPPVTQVPMAVSTIPGKPLALALTALIAVFLFTQQAPWQARALFAAGMEALGDGDIPAFNQGMTDARRLDTTNTYYYNLEACVLADISAYPEWFNPVDLGADRLARAQALFNKSLALYPGQELPHTHLAWLLLAEDPASAATHFRAAARLIPDKGGLYFGLGLCLLAQGSNADAAKALAMEMVNDPAFVASPEWLDLATVPGLASHARRLAATELERIAEGASPTDPLRYACRARYAAALLRWLDGDAASLSTAEHFAEPGQVALLRWLSGDPVQPPTDSPQAWHALARATQQPTQAAQILHDDYARRWQRAGAIPSILLALNTPDRRTLLLLPSSTPAALVPHSRRERTGYGLLLRDLDGPPPRDPHLVASNRIVRDFLQPLFPEKGYLPGPVLVGSKLVRSPE